MKQYFLAIILLCWVASTSATNSPYQGEENREIKSLSQEEVQGLIEGKGLGFAKAAELNHYPGPRHVLDLAKELNLSEGQVKTSQTIFNRMQAEAIRLGSNLVDREEALNKLFASDQIYHETLNDILEFISQTYANLRGVHLKAHIDQKQVLTQHQLYLYDKLRGYSHTKSHQLHSH